MKSSSTLRAFAVLAFLTGAAPVGAQDYQCQDAGGCSATIFQDGAARRVKFRKGDLVSTSSGWIVDTEDGWVRVPSDKGGRTLPGSTD